MDETNSKMTVEELRVLIEKLGKDINKLRKEITDFPKKGRRREARLTRRLRRRR